MGDNPELRSHKLVENYYTITTIPAKPIVSASTIHASLTNLTSVSTLAPRALPSSLLQDNLGDGIPVTTRHWKRTLPPLVTTCLGSG